MGAEHLVAGARVALMAVLAVIAAIMDGESPFLISAKVVTGTFVPLWLLGTLG